MGEGFQMWRCNKFIEMFWKSGFSCFLPIRLLFYKNKLGSIYRICNLLDYRNDKRPLLGKSEVTFIVETVQQVVRQAQSGYASVLNLTPCCH